MTAKRSNDPENAPDLDWLAFQYAAGELRGTELDQFEQLLATDERACAALAQAVLLGQAIVRCEQTARCEQTSVPVVVSIRSANRQGLWQPIAVACSVAWVVLGLVWWKPVAQVNGLETAKNSQVASLWIEGAAEDFNGDVPAQDGSNPDQEFDDDDAVPGWILAAVNLQQQDADDNEIMND